MFTRCTLSGAEWTLGELNFISDKINAELFILCQVGVFMEEKGSQTEACALSRNLDLKVLYRFSYIMVFTRFTLQN